MPDDRPKYADAEAPLDDRDSRRRWLATLYDRYAAGLYRYALMLLGDHQGAQDAVQQVFVKLAAMHTAMSQVKSHNGYLRQAVRNECYRLADGRRRRRTVGSSQAAPLLQTIPDDQDEFDDEQRQAVERALLCLPMEQREVVHLKIYDQMTFQQIADALNLSINTVASRYRYALAKLRTLLAKSL